MIYLLDTNAVIAILKNDPKSVRLRLRSVIDADAAITVPSVVLNELWYGVARSTRRTENTGRLRAFLSGPVSVVDFDEEDAVRAGEIRAALEKAGTPIGPYDVQIAAQAVRTGATLVTANLREFTRVDGLTVEDWA